MKIAVTSDDFLTVTGHAGRARRFLIYDISPAGEPSECARLDLSSEQTFHSTGGAGAHPIDGVAAVLSASFGAHFAELMAARGIKAVATGQNDPLGAVHDFLARGADGAYQPDEACGCHGACHDEGR